MGTVAEKSAPSRLAAALAADPGVSRCLEWFSRERGWINERHLRLCRIPAPTFFEAERAQWMASEFRALGWETRLDRAGNVIATREARRDAPAAAITAHLDTVLAPRSPDEVKVANDGRLLGPGVSDNGAGLAALLAIAAAWSATAPALPGGAAPVLVATVGEEGEGNLNGMRFLCRQSWASRVRGFFVLDGPDTGHITCRALASRRYDLAFAGKGGHSWSDFGTGNPIHALGRLIAEFSALFPAIATPGRSSFNFGVIEGGTGVNAIPSQARAKLDLRSEDASEMERLAAEVVTRVERALEAENATASAGRVTAKIKEIGSRPGGALPADAPILRCLLAADQQEGIRAHLDCASTDANIPLSMNLPALSIGAGGQGGGAHTPAEWFHPKGREQGLRRIALAVCLTLAEPGRG